MADESQIKPSFSPRRKWGIALDLSFRTLLVLVTVVVLNHLASRHFFRRYLSSQTRTEVSSRTVSLLKSFTNKVDITVYYSRKDEEDREDPYYAMIVDLLKEFHNINPRLTVKTVDPIREPGQAILLKKTYDLGAATNRNFIIFDCEGGGKKFIPGGLLVNWDTQRLPDTEDQKFSFQRVATQFRGEAVFASALLAVTSAKPLNAYFLRGHGEHLITGDAETGYLQFATLLARDYVKPDLLLLNDGVPADCNLLIIAGPIEEIRAPELEKINQYLKQGGRLLAMFTALSGDRSVGMEKLLKEWGVGVGTGDIRDFENAHDKQDGLDVIVTDFGAKPHIIMNPLVNLQLQLVLPRPVLMLPGNDSDSIRGQEIAFSGANAYVARDVAKKRHRFPLGVALERAPVPGVVSERGPTRIVVMGDSNFLDNQMIEQAANREFAHAAVNWLLDRPHMIEGVPPRALDRYRILLTKSQMQNLQWILLVAMPGAILAVGGLVWLRRRK